MVWIVQGTKSPGRLPFVSCSFVSLRRSLTNYCTLNAALTSTRHLSKGANRALPLFVCAVGYSVFNIINDIGPMNLFLAPWFNISMPGTQLGYQSMLTVARIVAVNCRLMTSRLGAIYVALCVGQWTNRCDAWVKSSRPRFAGFLSILHAVCVYGQSALTAGSSIHFPICAWCYQHAADSGWLPSRRQTTPFITPLSRPRSLAAGCRMSIVNACSLPLQQQQQHYSGVSAVMLLYSQSHLWVIAPQSCHDSYTSVAIHRAD